MMQGMKKRFALVALPLALAGLGACSTYGYDGYGYGYGYDDYGYGSPAIRATTTTATATATAMAAASVVPRRVLRQFLRPGASAAIGRRTASSGTSRICNGPYIRDYNRHFRRETFNGGKHYRYQDHRGNGHGGGNGWNDNAAGVTTTPIRRCSPASTTTITTTATVIARADNRAA